MAFTLIALAKVLVFKKLKMLLLSIGPKTNIYVEIKIENQFLCGNKNRTHYGRSKSRSNLLLKCLDRGYFIYF
jgi:hypothetical protein